MGIKDLWSQVGINGGRTNRNGRSVAELGGQQVAVELAGIMHHHLHTMTRGADRAKALATHVHRGAALDDPGLILAMGRSAIVELELMASKATHLWVIAECVSYPPKRYEAGRRGRAAGVAMDAKEFSKAAGVPDCAVEVVREWCLKQGNVTFVQPPGEAEAQIMHMLDTGKVAVGIVGSSDSDTLIYPCRQGKLFICAEMSGMMGGRMKFGQKGTQITGKMIEPANIWGNVECPATKRKGLVANITFADRALVAGMIGHDYDEVAGGVKQVGWKSVFKDVSAVRATIWKAGMNEVDYVAKAADALVANGKGDVAASAGQLKNTALAFMLHPVVDVDTMVIRTIQ
jgi:hypothetical protein